MSVQLYFFDDKGRPDPAGLNFRGVVPVENGDDSAVVNRCFIRWAAMWGGGTIRCAAHDARNAGVAESTSSRTPRRFDDGIDYWEVPGAARKVYIEGRRDNAGTVIGVHYLMLAK